MTSPNDRPFVKLPDGTVIVDRRAETFLTDGQIEEIAEKAAEKAVEKMTAGVYKAVGKSVVEKFLYLLGASTIGLYLYLKSQGILK